MMSWILQQQKGGWEYKCFWSNFFILFHFISLNWIIISCFISYFSLKYKKFELLVAFRPGNFGEVKGFFTKTMCQKLCIFIAFFTFKVVITPPTNPPNPFSAQQQWPCPIVQQYRLRHTPRSQQVRPNKQTNSQKKEKRGGRIIEKRFLFCTWKCRVLSLWLFSPSISSIKVSKFQNEFMKSF